MKRKITNFLVVLMIASGLSITCNSLSQGQNVLPNKRIKISEYGTLKELRSADGKILLGDSRRPLGEGYAVGYKFTNPQTGKREAGFVYAVGDEHSNNFEVAQADNKAATGNAVKTSVKTKDGALMLTHEFTLDEKSGGLKVKRTIQSLSSKGVRLLVVKSQASSWLVGIERPTPLQPRFDLKYLVRGVIRVGLCRRGCDCDGCPLPPLCPTWPRCHPSRKGFSRAVPIIQTEKNSWRDLKVSNIGKSDSTGLLRTGAYAVTLYWSGGKNMQDAPLQQGQMATIDVLYKMPNQ